MKDLHRRDLEGRQIRFSSKRQLFLNVIKMETCYSVSREFNGTDTTLMGTDRRL